MVKLRAGLSSKKDGFLANVSNRCKFSSCTVILPFHCVIIQFYHQNNAIFRQLLDTTALLELLKWNTPTVSRKKFISAQKLKSEKLLRSTMVGSRSQATRCMEESVLTWNQSRTTVQRWVL